MSQIERPLECIKQPSRRRWAQTATEIALALTLDPVALLAGKRGHGYPEARWRAWEELYKTGHYSISGIARASGFHHATILYGLRRVKGVTPVEAKKDRSVLPYLPP
jgi:hypothetical protein